MCLALDEGLVRIQEVVRGYSKLDGAVRRRDGTSTLETQLISVYVRSSSDNRVAVLWLSVTESRALASIVAS